MQGDRPTHHPRDHRRRPQMDKHVASRVHDHSPVARHTMLDRDRARRRQRTLPISTSLHPANVADNRPGETFGASAPGCVESVSRVCLACWCCCGTRVGPSESEWETSSRWPSKQLLPRRSLGEHHDRPRRRPRRAHSRPAAAGGSTPGRCVPFSPTRDTRSSTDARSRLRVPARRPRPSRERRPSLCAVFVPGTDARHPFARDPRGSSEGSAAPRPDKATTWRHTYQAGSRRTLPDERAPSWLPDCAGRRTAGPPPLQRPPAAGRWEGCGGVMRRWFRFRVNSSASVDLGQMLCASAVSPFGRQRKLPALRARKREAERLVRSRRHPAESLCHGPAGPADAALYWPCPAGEAQTHPDPLGCR